VIDVSIWWNVLKVMPVEGWPANWDGSIRVLPFFDTQKAEQIKQVINSEPIFHKTEDRSTRDEILQNGLEVADPDASIRGANKNPIGIYTQKNSIYGLYNSPTFAILNWKSKPYIEQGKYVVITETIPPNDLLTPKYYDAQDADDESSRLYFENKDFFSLNVMNLTEARDMERIEDSEYFQSDYTQWPYWDFHEFVKGIQEESARFWAYSFLPELIRLERMAGYYPQDDRARLERGASMRELLGKLGRNKNE
jgi:hypothetical protein